MNVETLQVTYQRGQGLSLAPKRAFGYIGATWSRVVVIPDEALPAGLAANAAAVLANGFVGERITTLSAEKVHAVCRALDVATGCG